MLIEHKVDYYICGDINIDLLQSETYANVKNYADTLFSLGCTPQINHLTRIIFSSATLIDHIYTNNLTPTILHKKLHLIF